MKDAAHQTENEAPSLPWFRYGMVWMIILLPLTAVVASLITVAIAYKHAPTLLTNAAAPLPNAAAPTSETVVERVEQP